MPSDNILERRSEVLTGLIKRRQEFADQFLGAGKQPPWTHKMNRTEKRQYFWSQPDDKKMAMWQQMDADERDVILGNDKPSKEQFAEELLGYGG